MFFLVYVQTTSSLLYSNYGIHPLIKYDFITIIIFFYPLKIRQFLFFYIYFFLVVYYSSSINEPRGREVAVVIVLQKYWLKLWFHENERNTGFSRILQSQYFSSSRSILVQRCFSQYFRDLVAADRRLAMCAGQALILH